MDDFQAHLYTIKNLNSAAVWRVGSLEAGRYMELESQVNASVPTFAQPLLGLSPAQG